MKIGNFAVKTNVSIDTIRYYMELGLIVPEKKGGHYDFDERCKKDLDDILIFKNMGFTMKEIKSIFLFKRLGKLTPYQADEYYKEIFINKHQGIMEKIEGLLETKKELERKIKTLSARVYEENFKLGVDINILNLFRCNKCGHELVLKDGYVQDNQILQGKLQCKCGQEYIIEDGILIVNNKSIVNDYKFASDYVLEYINTTSSNYLDKLYYGLEWAYKKMNFKEMKNKIILELGSGIGFWLRHIYYDLPDETLYLAVDYDIRKHKFLKNILEKTAYQKKIVFICSDFLDIPIKEKTVDLLIDYSGTSNYSFEHEQFLLKLIDNNIKAHSQLLGVYILFKNFSNKSLIGEKYRKNFRLENIKKEIKQLNYEPIDEKISDFVNQGGKYENYFQDDEQVYGYLFYGQR